MDTGNEPPVPAEPEPAGRPAAPHDRRRNPRGNFERSIDTVHRDAQAAELRAQRWTYQKIAEHLGYSDKGQAWRGVQAAKADVARPAVTKLIQAESEQLDDLYVMALEILDHNHVTVSHGKVVTWLNPETEREEPLPDDGPKLSAIQTALRIRESYRKLHGLDQPAQVAVSGAVRYEVVGVNPEELR